MAAAKAEAAAAHQSEIERLRVEAEEIRLAAISATSQSGTESVEAAVAAAKAEAAVAHQSAIDTLQAQVSQAQADAVATRQELEASRTDLEVACTQVDILAESLGQKWDASDGAPQVDGYLEYITELQVHVPLLPPIPKTQLQL